METALYSARARQVNEKSRQVMDGRMKGWMRDVSYNIRRDRKTEFYPFSGTETLPVGEKIGGS